MKASATVFTSAMLLCSWASAQTDPFQRGAPSQPLPTLRTSAAVGGAPAANPRASTVMAATPTSATVSTGGNTNTASSTLPTFGNPRSSSDGSNTRVVFDLPSGMTYTLAPTFSGLRIDVQGARVIPGVAARLGSAVSEYRAGGGQITLVTPFPLSNADGWRATEATIAGGTRVLILEFGGTLVGGAGITVKGKVLASAPVATTDVQAALTAPLPGQAQATAPAALPAGVAQAAQPTPSARQSANSPLLPPGDTIQTGPVLPPAPSLPGASSDKPSALTGKVPGAVGNTLLAPPRLGKNPGLTRVVLDLPPGATYRMIPGPLGLRVDLTGVSLGGASQMQADISPELRGWRYDAVSGGVNVSLLTGTPTTTRSGWRAQLLAPTAGSDRHRLAIDFSPALADTTPLKPGEKIVAQVPPLPTARGTAILALAASYVKPRVVIDPGHGGVDSGAVGSIVEKNVTLAVGLRVRELLSAAGVEVIMTRDADTHLNRDKNTDLKMRAAMANNAQLYVSIHVNSMPPANVLRGFGVETWYTDNHPLSQNLAALLQKGTLQTTAAFDQGLKSASFSVLRNSRVPAALVEIGYTSHPVDGLNLMDENYLDRVALGIANGIRDALITGVTADNNVTRGAVGGAGK